MNAHKHVIEASKQFAVTAASIATLRKTPAHKMSASQLAHALIDSTTGAAVYSTVICSNRTLFTQTVEQLNLILADMDKDAVKFVKERGAVHVLRNTCNRLKTDYMLTSSKNGGLKVIDRSESTKDSGKHARKVSGEKLAETVATIQKREHLSETAAESEIDALRSDLARANALIAELQSAIVAKDRTIAALTLEASQASESATKLQASLEKSEQRANSAESALRAVSTPPVAKTEPTDATFRNIRTFETLTVEEPITKKTANGTSVSFGPVIAKSAKVRKTSKSAAA